MLKTCPICKRRMETDFFEESRYVHMDNGTPECRIENLPRCGVCGDICIPTGTLSLVDRFIHKDERTRLCVDGRNVSSVYYPDQTGLQLILDEDRMVETKFGGPVWGKKEVEVEARPVLKRAFGKLD